MTKVKINLQKALEAELGSDTTHVPATVDIQELLEFSDIHEYEADIDHLLAAQNQIAIIWCIEDVKEVRPDLDDDQCWDVLQRVQSKHDANIGINWDVLSIAAAELFGARNNFTKR